MSDSPQTLDRILALVITNANGDEQIVADCDDKLVICCCGSDECRHDMRAFYEGAVSAGKLPDVIAGHIVEFRRIKTDTITPKH